MKKIAVTALILAISGSSFAQQLSFGGHEIPSAVQKLIKEAKVNGAVAYDINETNSNGNPTYTPYAISTQAVGNMTFEHTEITPEVLAADMNDIQNGTQLAGYTTEKYSEPDGAGNMVEKTQEVGFYKKVTRGTGNITAHFDHASHSDLFARGMNGQKWANNCGILEDGSIHCLPAMRKNQTSPYILTNPDLSRNKLMMYNGHIDVRAGVVVSVEVSGKLSTLIGKGRIKMIDPVAVLKAWGFKISPDLTIFYGNTTKGVPVQDPVSGLLVAGKQP
ncbi:MAG: hypothetical protein JNM39_10260 [Bdellovibrionaceae bacterium]|nr:hypothetical protein [Pseudobdellovibrionaceae bacterium]